MAIPDNFSFSLQDVADDMGLDDNIPPINSLSEAFEYSNEYGFDELYENLSDDTLREFRNYDHTAQAIVYTMSIGSNFDYTQVPWDGTSGTLTFNVSPDPNTVIGSFSTSASWITLSNNNNKTDGETVNITIASQPDSTSPERAGVVRVTSSSTGVNPTIVSITVTQDAGPDAGGPIP